MSATGQDGAAAGMVELQRQLDQARQELASRDTTSSTNVLVNRCADLERELQNKDQQLLEAQTAGSDTLLWTQLVNIDQERDRTKS